MRDERVRSARKARSRRLFRILRIGDIRTRLLVAFLVVVLLQATVTTTGALVTGLQKGRERVTAQLESVAALKETQVEAWMRVLQTDLDTALGEEAMQDDLRMLFQEDALPALQTLAHRKLQDRLRLLVVQRQYFDQLFLMDRQGQVVVSTEVTQEGETLGQQPYFQRGLEGSYVHLMSSSSSQGRGVAIAARPIADGQEEVLGVLAGRVSLAGLIEAMREQAGLGRTGKAYLVGADSTLLTPPHSDEEAGIEVRTRGASVAIKDHVDGSGTYRDYRGMPVVGVSRWLPVFEVALLVEQDHSEAFGSVYTMMAINAGLALVAVVLAVGVSLFVTRGIATPLADLTKVATQVAAGDLEQVVETEQEGEIGALARAFNNMTAQLREMLLVEEERTAELEQEVAERQQVEEEHSSGRSRNSPHLSSQLWSASSSYL